MSTVVFSKIAPYLQDPLVLIGFVLLLGFSFVRAILKAGIIPQLTQILGYQVIQRILLYGFVIAIILIGLGFGLKYRELSRYQQEQAVKLLDQELKGNIEVLGQLRANTETIVNATLIISKLLRTSRISILPILFPTDNIAAHVNNESPDDMAEAAIKKLKMSGLLDDTVARQKFMEAAHVIVDTINQTMPVIISLSDSNNKRYVITTDVWRKELPILRKVDIIDVTLFQKTYENLDIVRADYDVILSRAIDYLSAVRRSLDFKRKKLSESDLASALAAERIFIELKSAYLPDLIAKISQLRALRTKIAAKLESDAFFLKGHQLRYLNCSPPSARCATRMPTQAG